MKNRSDGPVDQDGLQQKLAGLGEYSLRKTYYPELQQRLEELERFKAFIDHSNDAIFMLEVPSGKIVDLNESSCRQLGLSRAELLDLTFYSLTELQHSNQAR